MTVCFLNVGYQSVLIFIGVAIIMAIIWRRVLLKSIQSDVLRWIAVAFFALLSTLIIFAIIIFLILGSIDQASWHK